VLDFEAAVHAAALARGISVTIAPDMQIAA
jgi:hypothetical protein